MKNKYYLTSNKGLQKLEMLIEPRRLLLITICILIFHNISFAQGDTTKSGVNNYSKIQLEAATLLFSNELGVLYDYDLTSIKDGKSGIGFRISTEFYNRFDFDIGGSGNSYSIWDFNLYARHSIRGKQFSVSPFIGPTFHLYNGNQTSDFITIKWGMEWEYNLYKDIVGVMLKWAFSITQKETGYLGLGVWYKINAD